MWKNAPLPVRKRASPPGNAGQFSTNPQILLKTPRIKPPRRRKLSAGVMALQDDKTPALRLEPEKRLCPEYDSVTIKRYRAPEPGDMGFRVLDNFCEEHIQ